MDPFTTPSKDTSTVFPMRKFANKVRDLAVQGHSPICLQLMLPTAYLLILFSGHTWLAYLSALLVSTGPSIVDWSCGWREAEISINSPPGKRLGLRGIV